ncbi:MAG: hypothetical protein LC754_11305 [Acidobacteria bacterium]|nr:hypothetical protein [Acidobacteriota bacterium]
MKKLVSLGLVSLMLIASLVVTPRPASAQGPGLVSSILNRMERNRRDLRSLHAGLVMQKYNAQLHDMDTLFGEVQYIPGSGRNMSVRVDWHKPQVEMLAVKDGQYTLYRPRLNMAYKGTTASTSKSTKVSSVLGFGLNASGAQLKSNFDVQPVGEGTLDAGGPHVVMLKLIPKGNAGYQFAEVWVDDSGMPVQTRVTEKNGDSTLVRLTPATPCLRRARSRIF